MTCTLTFLGAAQQVTGSCYLLESPEIGRILLDCGMHQGGDDIHNHQQQENQHQFQNIDAVILSHAHLDHSGLLPQLVHAGFEGPIYCSPATSELLDIMLHDSVGLYEYDLKKENIRRQRRGQKQLTPDYTRDDVLDVLDLCVACPSSSTQAVNEHSSVTFHDAGHILGSSIVELKIKDGKRNIQLVFSGDLGNKDSALMKDPTIMNHADVVLMEGTYGDRNHRSHAETVNQLQKVLQETWERGGNVMIPSFAVGRTQELLFHLGRLHQQGKLAPWKIFLDSPMAIKVTKLYDQWIQSLDPKDTAAITRKNATLLKDFLPNLQITEKAADSISINDIKSGALIIAGSGMCTGGRIRHHIKQRLWNPANCIIFAGFQARGTLGRILVDGAKFVKLYGDEYIVAARIETLGGFSAHAGQDELIEWVCQFRNNPRIMLVHGEEDSLRNLANKLHADHGIQCKIPKRGERITL